MMDLSRQFHDRIVKKTYFAIVNGIPPESKESTISTQEAYELGVDVDPNEEGDWQLIDSPLDDKSAVTVWRSVRHAKSLHAMDGYLTLVEMKPKTGRYHQLRRHMAWVCERPLIGDDKYDEATESAMKFRDRGLFLCSTRVSLEHPYYNSPEGRQVWENLADDRKYSSGKIWLSADDRVMVTATIDLPKKFESLLKRTEERHDKLAAEIRQ
jgi:23S rRNA-/tRNA-specific pseudouridylate synthase